MKLSWNVNSEKNITKKYKIKNVIFSRTTRTSSFSFSERWLRLPTVFINRLVESVCILAAQPLIVHIQHLVAVVALFNLKVYSSATSRGFPLFEFINEIAVDFCWISSIKDAALSAMIIEF